MLVLENTHALIVGIHSYLHVSPLPEAVRNDAKDIHALLLNPELCAYQPENAKLLLDDEATGAGLRNAFQELGAQCNSESTVFIYLSCHGARLTGGPYAGEYLLPVDACYTSNRALAESSLSSDEMSALLQAIPARKMVVVFDCCHAGGFGKPKDGIMEDEKSSLSENYYAKLSIGRGRVILASSRSTEVSWILPGFRNSLFTQHILKGLYDGIPAPGGVIRIFDLFDYVQKNVTSDRTDQHPIFKAEIEDNFPIAFHQVKTASLLTPPERKLDIDQYDLFISYRHQEPETGWVKKHLLPNIEAQGIRVLIDFRDFRLGSPLITEIERAVEKSRFTLAVLTPAYLKSEFANLENLLAQHLGLENNQTRLLVIIRDDCSPRLGIRAQICLDMTKDDEFDSALARLVFEIKRSDV